MFGFSRFSISKAHSRSPIGRLLTGTAIVVGFGVSALSSFPMACSPCQAQCASCGECSACSECSQCNAAYGRRTKPFSVLQLGSLVDGLDHLTNHLEHKLVHNHGHHHTGSCDCASCDAHLGTTVDDAVWSSDSTTSILEPSVHQHEQPIGTGVSEKAKPKQAPHTPKPVDPSSVPSLHVPPVEPHEDYKNNPFHDDARVTPKAPQKFRNRYTEQVASSESKERGTKLKISEPAKPQYSHAYKPEQFIAQQEKAVQNAPVTKAQPQRNPVELASAKSIRPQGIRVKVGNDRPIANEPVSTQQPAVYEATSSSNDLVQPAAALRLSN